MPLWAILVTIDRYYQYSTKLNINLDLYCTNLDQYCTNLDQYCTNLDQYCTNLDQYCTNFDQYLLLLVNFCHYSYKFNQY
jgi:hypothetical protein